jgi:hypothetical protein
MKGLIAQIIRKGEDAKLFAPVAMTTKRIQEDCLYAAETFRASAMNLFSCFHPLEGEFGLYDTLDNFLKTKNPTASQIEDAVKQCDEEYLIESIQRSLAYAFVVLFEKNALTRLQQVKDLPQEAFQEYIRFRELAGTVDQPVVASASAEAAQAPVAPVVIETPIEACVREFKEMPSQAWKAKWLNNRNNRPIADQAFEEGRI